MSERLKFEGKLYGLRVEEKRIRAILKGLIDSLRDALDPTEPAERLDRDRIQALAGEFGNKHLDLYGILDEIRKNKEQIGER